MRSAEFWARSASVACFISVDDDIDLWSIISERLRFLRMGFLQLKELLLESWLAAEEAESDPSGMVLLDWKGP